MRKFDMPAFNAHSPVIPTRSPFRIRDSQLAKMQQPNNNDRFSLAIEVNNMWNMKPMEMNQQHHLQQQQQHYNINMFSSSHLLTQLLVSQAILDSNEFEILTFENLDKLKKELAEVHDRVSNMSKSVELETRIIKISKSLENKNFKNSRHSVLYLQNQRQHNEHKMKYMVDQLDYLKNREIEIKKTLLQHNAAVLNKGIHTLESSKVSKPTIVDATQANYLENEMHQIIRRIDSISINIVPAHSDLSIPQKLTCIENYLTENQNQQTNDDEYEKYKGQQLLLIQFQKNDLLSKLLDMEALSNKLLTTITIYPQRQAALKLELMQYKSEATELKIWEKTKRNEAEEIESRNDNASQQDVATHSKYKKILQDQTSYFEDRLQEQNNLIQQNKRMHQSLEADYDRLLETKSNLDNVIKEKSRDMDDQDNKMSRLNYELRGQQRPGFNQSQDSTEREKQRVKKLFDLRESHWTEHTTMMEDSFDEIMDNFDTLTNQAIEFESHRMKYDKKVEDLNNTIQQLEMELINEKVKKIGHNNTGEAPTTASLRKEFRMLVADIKRAHQQRMDQEADEIRRLQSQLDELQNENNRFKYQHTMSTQTD